MECFCYGEEGFCSCRCTEMYERFPHFDHNITANGGIFISRDFWERRCVNRIIRNSLNENIRVF
jgi:hypothetical protein